MDIFFQELFKQALNFWTIELVPSNVHDPFSPIVGGVISLNARITQLI